MNCIIIEDQAPAQRVLQKFIQDDGRITLAATFNDALSAQEFLEKTPVDLIFLDIHLPVISGIEFLKKQQTSCAVILTTAFTEYAVQSYEFNVIDYLVKPFSFQRFIAAIDKFYSLRNWTGQDSFIFIKSGHEHLKVAVNEITHIHSDMDYTEVILIDGKKILSSETLANWEEELVDQQFHRIHKSYLINGAQLEKVTKTQVHLKDGSLLPIGRAYKTRFLNAII